MHINIRINHKEQLDGITDYADQVITYDLTYDDLVDLFTWAKHPCNEADLHDKAGEFIRNFQRFAGKAAKYARGDD